MSYLTDALEKSGLGASNLFVTYPADNRINASMFALADMRLIWGGDQKIKALSTMEAKPSCHTLNFADRFSLGLYKVEAYAGLTESERDELARKAYNDVYIFDQLACSSSRLIVWLGGSDGSYRQAVADFSRRLSEQARRMNYEVAPHTSMAKFAAANRSTIDHRISGLALQSPELTVVELSALEDVRDEASGEGFSIRLILAGLKIWQAFSAGRTRRSRIPDLIATSCSSLRRCSVSAASTDLSRSGVRWILISSGMVSIFPARCSDTSEFANVKSRSIVFWR